MIYLLTCLPPGIDELALAPADSSVVPVPGLAVDWLADRANGAQGTQVVLEWPIIAVAEEESQRRWCAVELRQLQTLHEFPIPACEVQLVRALVQPVV